MYGDIFSYNIYHSDHVTALRRPCGSRTNREGAARSPWGRLPVSSQSPHGIWFHDLYNCRAVAVTLATAAHKTEWFVTIESINRRLQNRTWTALYVTEVQWGALTNSRVAGDLKCCDADETSLWSWTLPRQAMRYLKRNTPPDSGFFLITQKI